MKIILNVEKDRSDHSFLTNEAALYFPSGPAPTRIIFEWFGGFFEVIVNYFSYRRVVDITKAH